MDRRVRAMEAPQGASRKLPYPLPEKVFPPGSIVALYVRLPPAPQPARPQPPIPEPEYEPLIVFAPEVITKFPPKP